MTLNMSGISFGSRWRFPCKGARRLLLAWASASDIVSRSSSIITVLAAVRAHKKTAQMGSETKRSRSRNLFGVLGLGVRMRMPGFEGGAGLFTYCASMAFFSLWSTGLSLSQIPKRAFLNASPLMTPFCLPFFETTTPCDGR
jgi:hypothetical protein